jgi:hypothetical protein
VEEALLYHFNASVETSNEGVCTCKNSIHSDRMDFKHVLCNLCMKDYHIYNRILQHLFFFDKIPVCNSELLMHDRIEHWFSTNSTRKTNYLTYITRTFVCIIHIHKKALFLCTGIVLG